MKTRRSRVLIRCALCAAFAVGLSLAGHAQSPPSTDYRVQLAITYQSVYAGRTEASGNFFTQGGAAEIDARVHRRLHLVLSVTGQHAGSSTTGGVPISFISSVVGPRYMLAPWKRTSPFFEVMGGGISAIGSRFPTSSGLALNAPTSANSFSLLAGGGLDVRLPHRLALRAIQADWIYTQLPNGSSNRQNNLRIGAGLVLPLGR